MHKTTRAPRVLWSPGSPGFGKVLTAHITLMSLMMIRGMDYATGESAMSARRLGAVEAAAPLWAWGLMFTTAASLGFAAMCWRWADGVLWAHTLGAALYASVGIGIVIDVAHHAGSEHSTLTWILLIPAGTLAAAALAIPRIRGPYRLAAWCAIGAVLLGTLSAELDGLRNSTVLFGVAVIHGALAFSTMQTIARERIVARRQEE